MSKSTVKGLHHVAINVKDMDVCIKFMKPWE